MRKRMLLIVAPLCVVAIAAGVAVAAPSDTAVTDTGAANPHPVRPIAASPSVLEFNALGTVLDQVAAYVHDAQAFELHNFLDGIAAEEAARQSAGAASGGASGDFLSCVRHRESRGDYTVHNSGGSGASGAYQFMPDTWNRVADAAGRSDLVGVDPAAASPADQDAMANQLYATSGAAPWGGGC
jgi:muramidase (phage lysozyme)